MLNEQLKQYVNLESVFFKGKDLIQSKNEYYQDRVMIIDKCGIYMYSCVTVDNRESSEKIEDVFSFSQIDDNTELSVIKDRINMHL